MTDPAERNVEIARNALAAFSAGDFDTSLATMHPDVEWHVFIPLPDLTQEVYRGTDEVRMIWTRLTAAFEVFTVEIGAPCLYSGLRGRNHGATRRRPRH